MSTVKIDKGEVTEIEVKRFQHLQSFWNSWNFAMNEKDNSTLAFQCFPAGTIEISTARGLTCSMRGFNAWSHWHS